MHSSARSDIDQIIGTPHRIFVVFDDDDGVPEIPEVEECVEQTFVISLMQTDGRLIQDVHHTDQTCSDLTRESDALGFPAG